jgi:uncharacterized protein with beta-barrel porin domain
MMAVFVISPAVPVEGQDSAVISVGLSVQWTPMISTYAAYDGQLGRGRYNSNAVTGGVRVAGSAAARLRLAAE